MPGVWDSLSVTTHAIALTKCGSSWAYDGSKPICDSFNRIYWLESGEARIEHDGAMHILRRGNLHVIPANSTGRYRCAETMLLHWCHFNAQLLGGLELYDCAGFGYDVTIAKAKWKEMDAKWRRLERLWGHETPKARFESNGILFGLLAEMASTAEESGDWFAKGSYSRFEKIFAVIEQRMEEKIKVGELASLAGLQENYFTNLFKASFGVAPMAYLKRRRIRRAQLLLKSSAMQLKEIAEKCGFGSEYHLSAAFKETVGIAPGAYRRSPAHETP